MSLGFWTNTFFTENSPEKKKKKSKTANQKHNVSSRKNWNRNTFLKKAHHLKQQGEESPVIIQQISFKIKLMFFLKDTQVTSGVFQASQRSPEWVMETPEITSS